MLWKEGVLGQWPDGSKKFAKNFTKKHFSQNTYKYVYKLVLLAAASREKKARNKLYLSHLFLFSTRCVVLLQPLHLQIMKSLNAKPPFMT